jgi:hypothetical protein
MSSIFLQASKAKAAVTSTILLLRRCRLCQRMISLSLIYAVCAAGVCGVLNAAACTSGVPCQCGLVQGPNGVCVEDPNGCIEPSVPPTVGTAGDIPSAYLPSLALAAAPSMLASPQTHTASTNATIQRLSPRIHEGSVSSLVLHCNGLSRDRYVPCTANIAIPYSTDSADTSYVTMSLLTWDSLKCHCSCSNKLMQGTSGFKIKAYQV